VQAGANLEAKRYVGPHAQGGHCADWEAGGKGLKMCMDMSCPCLDLYVCTGMRVVYACVCVCV